MKPVFLQVLTEVHCVKMSATVNKTANIRKVQHVKILLTVFYQTLTTFAHFPNVSIQEGPDLTARSLWSSSTERMFTHQCVLYVCVCVSSGLSRVMHSFHYPHQINVQHSSSIYCPCTTAVCVSVSMNSKDI